MRDSITILACLLIELSSLVADPGSRPNVVLILADDLGWQDVKCYDVDAPSPMETPNIDALAKKGVLFRQGYSPSPTCAPTRCAIMSGRHPAAAQKTHVVGGNPPTPYNKLAHSVMDPWYSGRMPLFGHYDRGSPKEQWVCLGSLGEMAHGDQSQCLSATRGPGV